MCESKRVQQELHQAKHRARGLQHAPDLALSSSLVLDSAPNKLIDPLKFLTKKDLALIKEQINSIWRFNQFNTLLSAQELFDDRSAKTLKHLSTLKPAKKLDRIRENEELEDEELDEARPQALSKLAQHAGDRQDSVPDFANQPPDDDKQTALVQLRLSLRRAKTTLQDKQPDKKDPECKRPRRKQ